MDKETQNKHLYAFINTVLEICVPIKGTFTNLHLQKFTYLSYGEYIKKEKTNLEYLEFEAWRLGPVIPAVYHYYSRLSDKDIDEPMVCEGEELSFHNNEVIFAINNMIKKYKNFSISSLINETHKKYGAWDRTIKENKTIISFDYIRNDF